MKKIFFLFLLLNLSYAINININGVNVSHINFSNLLQEIIKEKDNFLNNFLNNMLCSSPAAVSPSFYTDETVIKVCYPKKIKLDLCKAYNQAIKNGLLSVLNLVDTSKRCIIYKKDKIDKLIKDLDSTKVSSVENIKDTDIQPEKKKLFKLAKEKGAEDLQLGLYKDYKNQKDVENERIKLIAKLSMSSYLGDKFNNNLENYKMNVYFEAFRGKRLILTNETIKNLSQLEKAKFNYILYKQNLIDASILSLLKELEMYETQIKEIEDSLNSLCYENDTYVYPDFKYDTNIAAEYVKNFDFSFPSIVTSPACTCAPSLANIQGLIKKDTKEVVSSIIKTGNKIIENIKKTTEKQLDEIVKQTNYEKSLLLYIKNKELSIKKKRLCLYYKLQINNLKILALNTKVNILKLLNMADLQIKKEKEKIYEKIKTENLY